MWPLDQWFDEDQPLEKFGLSDLEFQKLKALMINLLMALVPSSYRHLLILIVMFELGFTRD